MDPTDFIYTMMSHGFGYDGTLHDRMFFRRDGNLQGVTVQFAAQSINVGAYEYHREAFRRGQPLADVDATLDTKILTMDVAKDTSDTKRRQIAAGVAIALTELRAGDITNG
ncbi:MAG: hypothetical protein ABIA93_06975 [Candidatus Woesearchaeota archaeon]